MNNLEKCNTCEYNQFLDLGNTVIHKCLKTNEIILILEGKRIERRAKYPPCSKPWDEWK